MEKIRKFENLHIFLWLIKDTCWVMTWKIPGLVMIVPTVFMAIIIAWWSRRTVSELLHNIAVLCWILANSTWMVGEFFYNDTTRSYASVFFGLGLAIILYYYLIWIPFYDKKKNGH